MKTMILKGLFLCLVFLLCNATSHAAEDLITQQITIKLDKAGTLPEKIESSKKYKITNLKIAGEINGTDLRMIREMAGSDYQEDYSTEGKLSVLDLSEAKIVAGGDAYWMCNVNSTTYRCYTSNDEIGEDAFYNCSSLTSLILPTRVIQIGDYAFQKCSNLISITIPARVTKIGKQAFEKCSNLISITLPAGVTEISPGAFWDCSGLTNLTLPVGITKIGSGAFHGCRSLTSLTLPASITEIDTYAFQNCSGLMSLTIPAGVTYIRGGVFECCSGLASVTLPAGITEIGRGAFYGCSGLTSLTLPTGVTEIGRNAFYGCSSLTSFEIPSSVKTIWNGAFAGCNNLTHIVCNPMVAPSFNYEPSLYYDFKHLCEEELQNKITLIAPLGASGYTTGEWSLFKKPDEIRLTDTQCSIVNQGCCPIGNFSYSRTQMKSGSYATFCLPFDTNLSEVSDKFEAVYIPNQTALLNPDGKLILLLQKYDKNASLAAGQAVVVKLKSGVTDVAFSNNKLMMVESDVMQNSEPTSLHVFDWNGNSGALLENTDVKVSFGGTLTSMTGKGSEYETFNSNGSFGPTKSGVVKAFRAYVLKENAAANSRIKSIAFGLGDDSETTGVKMISIPVENKQGDDVYTIDGRLINNTGDIEGLPSGIYIKNHQKIYVK